jgi:hypothetical protein
MATSKTTPKPQSKRKPADPDAPVIAACVKFAQCTAAIAAGFSADPNGDFKYAGPERASAFERDAAAAIAFLGKHNATTPEGLSAKSRIVPVLLNDDTGWIGRGGTEFLSLFAADVKSFTEPLVLANYQAADEPRKAARS